MDSPSAAGTKPHLGYFLAFTLGALASAGLWFWGARSEVAAQSTAPQLEREPRGASAVAGDVSSAGDLDLVRSAELGESRRSEEDADVRTAVASAPIHVTDSGLIDQLVALHDAGAITDLQLAQLMIPVLARRGDVDAAFALAERYIQPRERAYRVVLNAAPCNELGSACARLAELAWRDGVWPLGNLLGYAPQLVLAELEAQVAANGGAMPAGNEHLYLQALSIAGRDADVLRRLDEMLAANPGDEFALAFLAGCDPTAAEQRYRALIAAGDLRADWNEALLELWRSQGRAREIAAALAEMPAGRVAPDEWERLATEFHELGDDAGAIDALLRGLVAEQGDPDSLTQALSALAPQVLLDALEQRALQGANDEFWGALADARWHAGRHADAIAAWTKAFELDPGDEEWPHRLAQIQAGADPFD